MTIAIKFTGVTKNVGQVLAVDDLNAVAQPGEVTALLGPNGAGKTTTLRTCSVPGGAGRPGDL